MATSGSVSFTRTRDEIITAAYQTVNILRKGESPTADEVTYCTGILNEEMKFLSGLCPHLWKRRIAYLFPETGKFDYYIGNDSGADHIFSDYIATELTEAGATGDTVITVDDSTGIEDGYYIGIVKNDGTIFWTTVNGAPPSSTTVTIDTALTEDIDSGNMVYVGAVKITRPVAFYSAWRETISTSTTISRSPMIQVAYNDYYTRFGGLINSNGIPTQIMWDNKAVDGSTAFPYSLLHILPSGNQQLNPVAIGFVYETQMEDIGTSGQNPDVPSEWLKLLRLALARELSTSDAVPDRIAMKVEALYRETFDILMQHDSDNSTFKIEPGYEEQNDNWSNANYHGDYRNDD